jgi:pullulanase/glycogen debranching enzyme
MGCSHGQSKKHRSDHGFIGIFHKGSDSEKMAINVSTAHSGFTMPDLKMHH